MAKYPPLPDNASIRLLVLHPGDAGDELKASFVLEDLDHPQCEYEALSYYWGPPLFPQRIQIDGTDHDITQTLYNALIRLRFSEEDRILWADAVSINQNSDQEKGHQVRLMSRIYSQCTRGVIYLGLEEDGSELLPDFFSYVRDWFLQGPRFEDSGFMVEGFRLPSLCPSQRYGLPPKTDRRWTALRALYRRPWFRRIWIMQEFALPKDLVTICGHWELNGTLIPGIAHIFTLMVPMSLILDDGADDICEADTLARTLLALDNQKNMRVAVGHTWNPFNLDFDMGQFMEEFMEENPEWKFRLGGRLKMYSLWRSTDFCNVTDPRDAFYGLVGLANDLDDDPDLLPDYDKTLTEIQAAFFAFFFRQGFGYQILSEASFSSSLGTLQPSWMNLSMNFSDTLSYALRAIENSTGANIERRNTAVSLISNTEVAVLGYLIDRIRCQTVASCDHTLKIIHEISAIFNDGLTLDPESYKQISLSDSKRPDTTYGESYRRMALRMLCLDTSANGERPASEKFLDLCEKYLDVYAGTKSLSELIPERSSNTVDQVRQEFADTNQGLCRSLGGRFGSTVAGYYGMFPRLAEIGDQIFMIDGSARTFVVRHQQDTDTYLWVGEAYIHHF